MKRRVMWIALAVVAAVSLLAWMLLSGRGPAPPQGELTPAHEAPTPTPAPRQQVTLLFAGFDGLLHAELRTVEVPAEVEERVRVVVRELLLGPSGEELQGVAPYPADLLGVFVDHHGHVFVDLTPPPAPLGGSHTELLFAYGLVNSVLLNCTELSAVQILFGGQEAPTLSGHLDLSRPIPLNSRFIHGL
jgi:hypothetical protein